MFRLLLLSWLGAVSLHAAGRVTVAAASDLVFCLEDLNQAFLHEAPDVRLTVTTGSSGNLFAQIRSGAPYDVFLSADRFYPLALIGTGAADAGSLTPYAVGRLVLWTRRTDLDPADPAALLRDPRLRRFAIANPDHAPYGRAAREALQSLGVWDALAPKLVLGENISQAAQFVETGHADAGIVALALVLSPRLQGVGRYVEIPERLHKPLEQAAVLTKRGAHNPAAARYLAFLRSEAARAIFDRHGFRLPE